MVLAVQERAARSKGLRLDQFSRFQGAYRPEGGGLVLRITGGTLASGGEVAFNLEIPLGGKEARR